MTDYASDNRPFRVIITTNPHLRQRYNTIGDWTIQDDGTILIRVSKMPSFVNENKSRVSGRKQEFLIAIHELVEAFLCSECGITSEQIDDFDFKYLDSPQMQDTSDEPGDHPFSPYKEQHCIATGIERTLASILKVDWNMYEKNMETLMEDYNERRGKEVRKSDDSDS